MERIPGYATFYYWAGMLIIWQARRLKYQESADKAAIKIADFFWFFILSVGVGAGLSLGHAWLNWVLFIVTETLFLGLWLDTIVMNQLSIQINSHALRIYLANAPQMANESMWVWRNVVRKPILSLFPLASFAFYFLFILKNDSQLWCFALPPLGLYCLAGRSEKRQNSVLPAAAATTVILSVAVLFQFSLKRQALSFEGSVPTWIALATVGILLAILGWQNVGTVEGLLRERLVKPSWFPGIQSKRPARELERDFSDIIEIPLQRQQRSDCYNQFHGSNIILVTLESISQSKVAFYSGQGANMSVYETLARRGLSSRRHFCISPNTNNALTAIYNGNYRKEVTFPHLETLHRQGYKSVAIVPQDTTGFGLDKLLHKMGFQHIIDLNTFPEYPLLKDAGSSSRVYLVDDEMFYECANDALQKIVSRSDKVFLHVMNSQTHFPYVAQTQAPHDDFRVRYVQAVEEADNQLGHFLLQIDQLVPMRDSLLVYTADHGESLGERGYKAHSTAITREQVNVPFVLNHPGIRNVEVPFSTHFDIFPTLFDLLGVEYDYPAIGSSMLAKDRELNAVLFSETRHRDTPSCYGHVGAQTKIFFDVALDRYQLMDLEDNVISELSGRELQCYRSALNLALENRGLLVR